jgi:magnesium chelatase subunit I
MFASTLGELKSYRHRSIKDEMRENLMRKLREGAPVFPGILGYDDSVVPQIVNAVLSRHNMILSGAARSGKIAHSAGACGFPG